MLAKFLSLKGFPVLWLSGMLARSRKQCAVFNTGIVLFKTIER